MKRLLNSFQIVMVLLLITLMFFINLQLTAQDNLPLEWHTFYGAHATELHHADQGKAIIVYDGFLYVAGFVDGPGNFDGATIKRPYQGQRDGFVAKMTLDGETVEWVSFFGANYPGTSATDECLDITVSNDKIYVCGYSGNWADESSYTVKHPHYCCGGSDAFVAKLNLSGDIDWISFLGGVQGDFATAISVDETSGFINVTGHSNRLWTVDSYQSPPLNTLSEDWQYDVFAAKLDLAGNLFWHTFMGGNLGNGKWDYASGIGHDSDGNIYVGGSSRGTWGTPIAGFEHHFTGSDIYGEDGFIAKLSPNGVRDWHIFIGTPDFPGNADQCHDIIVDEDGNIYATGYTWGDWDSDYWGTPLVAYGENEAEDKFVTKINTNGVPQWHTILGAAGGDQGHDLILMGNGDLIFTGTESATWGNPVLPKPASNSGADVFAAKLDNDGNLLWNAIMGGFYTDRGQGVTADAAGNIYTTGFSMFPWECVDPPLHPHVGASSNILHTEIFISKLNTEVSAFSPETVSFSVIQGETVSTVINVFDPCGKLTSLIAGVGDLVDNMDGTWTWSLETSGTSIGNHEITISADDQAGWTPHTIIDLEVLPANQPPTFTVDTDPLYVELCEMAINTGDVTDPDEDYVGLNSNPGGPSAIVNNGDGTWTWSMETGVETTETILGLGHHWITIWADDLNGGVVFRHFDLFVEDNTLPLPDLAELPIVEGECEAIVEVVPTATDNCEAVINGTTEDPLSYSEQGNYTVTWIYDDGNDNYSTQMQTVTVVDDDPPTITFCPPAIGPIATDAGSCTATVDPGTATATDNCSVDVVGERDDGGELDDPYPFGIVTITWTASDQAGNSDVCTQTITVNKITPFLRTDIGHIVASYGDEVTLMAHLDPYDCDGFGENPPPAAGVVKFYIIDPVYGSQYMGEVNLNVAGDGTAALTVLLPEESEGTMSIGLKDVHAEYVPSAGSDFYGAELNHYGALEIVENLPPEISCPADLEVSTNEGCAWVGDLGVPIASDDADLDLDIDNDAPVEFPIGTTTVTWTATDDEGLFGSCIQMVTIVDNTPPVINLEQAEMDIEIWPPNHKYQTYSLDDLILSVEDNCTELSVYDVNIIYATSDELEDAEGEGDGNTLNDIVISEDCKSIDLRKERQGGGNGRVYKIFLAINDASGNVGPAICQVKVPHNNGEMAIDDGELYEVASNCDNRSFSIVEKGIEKFKVSLYPNPVLSELTIAYELREAANVTLAIYNCFGEVVFQVNYDQQEGKQQLHWNSEKYPNGIYYFRIHAGDKIANGKIVKVR